MQLIQNIRVIKEIDIRIIHVRNKKLKLYTLQKLGWVFASLIKQKKMK